MYEVASINNAIANTGVYSSLDLAAATEEVKAAFFNTVSGQCESLKDHCNEVLEIKDIYAERAESVNEETGEVVEGVRMIFIAPDGTGYATSSKGVANTLTKLFAIWGTPDKWTAPMKIIPRLKTRNNKNILVFEKAV